MRKPKAHATNRRLESPRNPQAGKPAPRFFTPGELATLAQRLAKTDDPAEAERLKTSIAGGLCGE
jgi:hypothetical protein